MQERIAGLMEWLLGVLLPAPGRHRAIAPLPALRCMDAPTVRLARVPVAYVWLPHGRGATDTGLVPPYVVAHDRQHEAHIVQAAAR